jgi:hypothetical protein
MPPHYKDGLIAGYYLATTAGSLDNMDLESQIQYCSEIAVEDSISGCDKLLKMLFFSSSTDAGTPVLERLESFVNLCKNSIWWQKYTSTVIFIGQTLLREACMDSFKDEFNVDSSIAPVMVNAISSMLASKSKCCDVDYLEELLLKIAMSHQTDAVKEKCGEILDEYGSEEAKDEFNQVCESTGLIVT